MQYNIILYYSIVQYSKIFIVYYIYTICMMLYSILFYSIILYYIVAYYIILCYIMLYYVILYYIILCYIMLYYVILYYKYIYIHIIYILYYITTRHQLIPISPRFSDPPSWLKLRINTIPGHLLSTGHLAQHGSKDVGHHQQIMGVYHL